MEKIDFLNWILLLLGGLFGSCVFIFIHNENLRNIVRRILILGICATLLFLIGYYLYLEKSIDNTLFSIDKEQVEINKDVHSENDVKTLKDSLLLYKAELEKVNNQLEKYSKLIDVKDKKSALNIKIKRLDAQIELIESYNEVMPNSEFSYKRKGESWSGETSSVILYPPNSFNSSHLDFDLRFINDNMVKNIACIYVQILRKNKDGSLTQLWDEYYKPRKGVNKVRVKNYLNRDNVEMRIGYFWKKDLGTSDYPKFEFVRFSLN